MLLTPAPDVSLEKAVQFIRGGFSFRLQSNLDDWKRSYNETRVVDAVAYDNFRVYIEQNPVRARLVADAASYGHSSLHRKHDVDGRPTWFGGEGGQG